MKARGLLFGVAVAFAIWNIMVNGVNVRTVAIAVMILLCLAMNIYNYHQKKKIRQEEETRSVRRKKSAVFALKPAISSLEEERETRNKHFPNADPG